jgi:hypothetical protein
LVFNSAVHRVLELMSREGDPQGWQMLASFQPPGAEDVFRDRSTREVSTRDYYEYSPERSEEFTDKSFGKTAMPTSGSPSIFSPLC